MNPPRRFVINEYGSVFELRFASIDELDSVLSDEVIKDYLGYPIMYDANDRMWPKAKDGCIVVEEI